MKLEIPNKNLIQVINFLDGIPLKGLKAIHRTNLSLKLQGKLKLVSENERQLHKDLKNDKEKLRQELEEFLNEKTIIDDGDSQVMLRTVKNVVVDLVESEKEDFKNDDSYAVTILYEQFGGDE